MKMFFTKEILFKQYNNARVEVAMFSLRDITKRSLYNDRAS